MDATLPSRTISAGDLLQHASRSVYRAAPLHFGRTGSNRYDAPDGTFGVLYLGFDLATVLMESMFRNHRWHRRKRRAVSLTEVKNRIVRVIGVTHDLFVVDLTAPETISRHFGLNLTQLSSRRYEHTQGISRTINSLSDDQGNACFDGLIYPSRNNYPATCLALFEQARHKVGLVDDVDLVDHIDWPGFVSRYGIGIIARD